MSQVEIETLMVAVSGGLIAAYMLAKAILHAGVATIFAAGRLSSPVAHEITATGAIRSSGKLALYGVAFFSATSLTSRWIELTTFNTDSETFVLAGAIALIGTVARIPRTLHLAYLRAWQPGFAEEYDRTPIAKRDKLLREWTRLRLGERPLKA
jgi:hypothetical protein